jgi:hypothetical protein
MVTQKVMVTIKTQYKQLYAEDILRHVRITRFGFGYRAMSTKKISESIVSSSVQSRTAPMSSIDQSWAHSLATSLTLI